MLISLLTFKLTKGDPLEALIERKLYILNQRLNGYIEGAYYLEGPTIFILGVWQGYEDYSFAVLKHPIDNLTHSKYKVDRIQRYEFDLSIDLHRMHLTTNASTLQVVCFPPGFSDNNRYDLHQYIRSRMYQFEGNVGVLVGQDSHNPDQYIIRSDWVGEAAMHEFQKGVTNLEYHEFVEQFEGNFIYNCSQLVQMLAPL